MKNFRATGRYMPAERPSLDGNAPLLFIVVTRHDAVAMPRQPSTRVADAPRCAGSHIMRAGFRRADAGRKARSAVI